MASAALAAPPRVALVLDGSGSMWGRIEGTEKIVIAREVLGEVLAELPAGTQVGLAAYGHRREGACDDIEILLPVGEHSREELEKVIHGVQPRG
ncbi:MAG TPA: VWA domain-containing protein, partial [Thermoanaerobaculia bacterium]|nr:VWA domain-containing protein [Thermoanaerobaculia bacterium]